MPPPRKRPEDRQRRNTPDLPATTSVETAGQSAVAPPFEAKPGWLLATRKQWDDLWTAPIAAHFQSTDFAALERLYEWRDRQSRTMRRANKLRKEADQEPLIDGSQGQPVENPKYRQARAADDEALAIEGRIVALEDRLGLSPKSRLALGLVQQQALAVASRHGELLARLTEVTDAPDPRASR